MTKRDKALIKLLGAIATRLVVIAVNIALANSLKEATTEKDKFRLLKDLNNNAMANINEIDKIVTEAIDD